MPKQSERTRSEKLKAVSAARTPVQKLILRLASGKHVVRLRTASEAYNAAAFLTMELLPAVSGIPSYRQNLKNFQSGFSVGIVYIDAMSLASVHEWAYGVDAVNPKAREAFIDAFSKVPAVFLGLKFSVYDFDAGKWRHGLKPFIPCAQVDEWMRLITTVPDDLPPIDVPPLPAHY